MAEPDAPAPQGAESRRTYTLSEVAKKTGISMPTLQRYKKLYQSRLPSVGQGRKQRYPDEALPVFEAIKTENAGKRGRPRKDPSAPRRVAAKGNGRRRRAGAARRGPGRPPGRVGRPPGRVGRPPGRRGRPPGRVGRPPGRRGRPPGTGARRGRPAGGGNLLTLTAVSERTGISYPTLVRYVRLYSNRLPHVGTGRARRFRPEAVEVFRQLRSESGRGGRRPGTARGGARRGRPPASEGGVARRVRALEKSQAALEKRMQRFVRSLQRLFK